MAKTAKSQPTKSHGRIIDVGENLQELPAAYNKAFQAVNNNTAMFVKKLDEVQNSINLKSLQNQTK